MNGTIAVHSILNGGSTFTVTVPVCPTSSTHVQPEPQNLTVIGLAPGQPHPRILVVDDQPENRSLMVRLLTQRGLEVREAANGQEAVQIWQDWQPDLTWMDIRMPKLDGYEATKQIRAMEQDQASIIIALAAQASHSDRTLALAAGCNDYISKPFWEETVFLKMAEYLGLEYLYAESDSLLDALPNANSHPGEDRSRCLDLTGVYFPPRWLQELEDAALCGNDRMITELTKQLPSELTQIADHLTELANQFQFEQILDLIHSKLTN